MNSTARSFARFCVLRERLRRVIAEERQRNANLGPLPLATKHTAQNPLLTGPHLDQRLVRLKFDNQIARLECLAGVAVPLQHANFLYVLGHGGNGHLVDHSAILDLMRGALPRPCKRVRPAETTRAASGRQAASRTGLEETGAATAPTRHTGIGPRRS